ncbi:small-conductance mechanosensitive channel [Vibrio ponticus]|nr:small-conductance mechanosensitive channel [Vibrio ponticus]
MKRFVYHDFSIVVRDFVNLYPMLPLLTNKIEEHCQDFSEVARRYNSIIERHAGVDLPGSEPHIHINSTSTGEQNIHVMIFCPTDQANHIEQLIRQDFMVMYEERFPVKNEQ